MAFRIPAPARGGSKPGEDIHIAALGWEHDRIVAPFLPQAGQPPSYKPHRLVLVAADLKGALGFDERIKASLDGVCEVDVVEVIREEGGKFVAFENMVEALTNVMAKEIQEGNRVFINISGGSKLEAFASGLASMAYLPDANGRFYYVQPDHYAKDDPRDEKSEAHRHGMGVGFKAVIEFPALPIGAPTMPRLAVLRHLYDNPHKNGPHDILRALHEVQGSDLADLDFRGIDHGSSKYIGGTQRADANARMRLKRGFLDPLVLEDYLDVTMLGRRVFVSLTNKGKMYARLAPKWPVFTTTPS